MTSTGSIMRAAVLACMVGAVPAAAIAAQCQGGWSGTIQYTRSQSKDESKTVERISGKGTDQRNWSMTYNYTANIAVRATDDPDVSVGRANITLNSSSTETNLARDQQICPHTTTWRTMTGSFVSKSVTTGTANGLEANVHIGLDSDGTYGVSIGLPDFKGTLSGSETSSFSGQCTPKKGVNNTIAGTPITIDGVTFTTDRDDQVSPKDPDRLTGSHSVNWGGMNETMTWNLRRCGGALRLVDVKFEDMRVPTWEDWQDITEQTGTTDGNIVRITAIVANDSPEEKSATIKFQETFKGDKWDGARPDGFLADRTVTVPAGEERKVQFEWDSSGYAWYDDGRPRPVQRLKAKLIDGSGKTVDEATRNLKVTPKPVILVHGLWSNWRAWELWQNILTTSHSHDWKAYPVGEKAQHGRLRTGEEVGNLQPTNTIAQNADQLARYIEYARKERNAWHIDIVAHSMGGLISRRYINATMPTYETGKPQVAHLVMLGTPNMGSFCADIISVPLETAGKSMDALRELRPSVVERFNAANGGQKGVEFSILAGNPLSVDCYAFEDNDGVVTVPSAIWNIDDSEQQSVLHTEMATVKEFSSFVKPRIAIGPSKQPKRDRVLINMKGPGGGPAGSTSPASPTPDFSKVVSLQAGKTLKVQIPVKEAANFGLTFVAANKVSATLTDDQGAVVASNPADKPEASRLFRSLFVDRPVNAGTWTLTLQNTDEFDREAVLSTWSRPK